MKAKVTGTERRKQASFTYFLHSFQKRCNVVEQQGDKSKNPVRLRRTGLIQRIVVSIYFPAM
jgi:hypothetical protein